MQMVTEGGGSQMMTTISSKPKEAQMNMEYPDRLKLFEKLTEIFTKVIKELEPKQNRNKEENFSLI